MRWLLLLLLPLLFLPQFQNRADVVFINGNVITVNDNFEVKEAIAIRENRVMLVGSDEEIRGLTGLRTEVIDLKGRSVLPGFEDSHIHFLSLAAMENQLDLSGVRDIGTLIGAVREKAESIPDGSWVLGRGWDQERMDWERDYRWPSREDLDLASSDNPVYIVRVCGHVAVVNSRALEIAGINKDTPDPPMGIIDRYDDGEPTGVLREEAASLVSGKIPVQSLKPSQSDLRRMLDRALADGITCIEEAGVDRDDIDIYEEAFERGDLSLRVNLLLDADLMGEYTAEESRYEIKKDRLRVCGIKFYADGSLGGRTAALNQPYSDDPQNRGVLIMEVEELKELFDIAHTSGFQCCTHAIGDRAIEVVLEANRRSYESSGLETGIFRDRIEHCQITDGEIIEEIREQNMIASIQFSFAASDSPWAAERVGERIKTSYAWRTMMEKGIKCCGGTDAPVESFSPMLGIGRIITRDDNPGEALTLEQAIRLYTMDSAYAQFQESELGSLEEGKLADLVVLSGDMLNTPKPKIDELKVDITMVDGVVVYARDGV